MKTLTADWLKEKNACREGTEWFNSCKLQSTEQVLLKLVEDEHYNWANWLLVRIFTHEQKVRYAIFAARQVLHIFEKKYPDNKKPREAIEAAEAWLKNPNEETRQKCIEAGRAAAYAAYADAYDAYDAYAAYAAAYAADAAAAAYADAYAAAAYAADAADAYAAAKKTRKAMQLKIVEYGIELMKESW